MYKVMIVDDEPIVSLMIKSISNWEENNIEIAFEASNGKEALKILEQQEDVDIIITDLNMPIMDGLDLIKNVKERFENIKIVVLSAYEDYPLIRSAFKLGAEDYILKTEIDEHNILDLLKSIINKLEEESKDFKKSEIDIITKREVQLSKHNFIKTLINNYTPENIYESIVKNKIRISNINLVVFFILIDEYKNIVDRFKKDNVKEFTKSVLNIVEQVLLREDSGEIISLSSEEYVVIYSINKNEENDFNNYINLLLKNIKEALFNYINISISIGISSIENDYEKIRDLYNEAERNGKFRFVLGKNSMIFSKDIKKRSVKNYLNIISKADKFILALKNESRELIYKELEVLLILIKENIYENVEQTYAYYVDLVFIIINCFKEFNQDITVVLEGNINLYDKINTFETCEEANIWIKEIVEKVILTRTFNESEKYSYPILRAINFIKDNYQKEDMSIKMVSNFVELSENYFSVLFSGEYGESFKDYIIKLRINKAKELIEQTNMKIYEICEAVGYRNVEHFSRIFKKVSGESPNSFKKNKIGLNRIKNQ